MKKLVIGFLGLVAFTVFAVMVLATPSRILYFLNWGEYIDTSLVTKFEDKYHCQVILETVTSSEAMYQKITSGSTPYDVAIPGDYTVATMYKEGRLRELDVKNDSYPNLKNYKTMYSDDLANLMKTYMVDENGSEYNSYFAPYFYGAYSIIYSTRSTSIGGVVEQNGMASLYNPSLFSSKPKVGMYDTARWIVASDLMSKGLDPNLTSLDGSKSGDDLDAQLQNQIVTDIKAAGFSEFGNDSLKRNVANGSLDFCFTQLGDFFDTLYLLYSEGSEVKINVSVPTTTAAFFDSMVIPTTCQNYELANQFIDFFSDPENAYQNACTVGYSPTLKAVCDLFNKHADEGEYYFGDGEEGSLPMTEFLKRYPMYLNPLGNVTKAYILEPKSNLYLTSCESIFNRALA